MTYVPIQSSGNPKSTLSTFMAKSGVDLRDLPQLLDTNHALDIKNYFITSEGGLAKRKGYNLIKEDTGSDGLTMLKEWKSNIFVYGYGTNLKIYDNNTSTTSIIKTDFVEAHFNGVSYGNYFLVASPQDKIGRISMVLDYDTQTANFITGLVLTGATSGATAIILEDSDSGTTGTLTLGDISGTFIDNEIIADSGSGSATTNGVAHYTYTTITNAPKARGISVIGNRCYAYDLEGERDAIQYSDVDDGSNPPFDSWNISTVPAEGNKLHYRGAGTVKDVLAYSKFIVVFAGYGYWSFFTSEIDSGGSPKRIDTFNMYTDDGFGGNRAIMTDKGVFYVNKSGIYRLVQLQQENVDYSKQEELTSKLLGNKFFDNIVFDDVDIAYIKKYTTIIITCRNNSTLNNYIIAYNIELNSFSFFTGISANCFMQTKDNIYFGASNSNKIYKLFVGNDDDGSDIWTKFYQEIKTGSLDNKKMLVGEFVQGWLSPSSAPKICFDIYDKRGNFIANKKCMTWSNDTVDDSSDEYGSAVWGSSVWGGDADISGMTENYAGARLKIRNYQRIRIKITEHSKVPHIINYFTLITKEKKRIRKRNLTIN